MDAHDQVGGTPPKLWDMKKVRPLIWNGLFRDRVRIRRLCRQVEKLSWMLELMDQEPGINLEEAELQWQYEHASLS